MGTATATIVRRRQRCCWPWLGRWLVGARAGPAVRKAARLAEKRPRARTEPRMARYIATRYHDGRRYAGDENPALQTLEPRSLSPRLAPAPCWASWACSRTMGSDPPPRFLPPSRRPRDRRSFASRSLCLREVARGYLPRRGPAAGDAKSLSRASPSRPTPARVRWQQELDDESEVPLRSVHGQRRCRSPSDAEVVDVEFGAFLIEHP